LTAAAALSMALAMSQRWLRIAHRGASGSAPEHTRPAFERALRLGADMIELDVQVTRDHELVVIHDLDLDRTTTGSGPVRDQDLSALQRLDAGSWFGPDFAGQRVLSLEEVIELVAAQARLNVEMKAPLADWPALATRLTTVLRTHGLLESTIISCFEPVALLMVRERSSDARLGVLWQRPDFVEAWDWARRLRAISLHPHSMLVSAGLIDTAHARGLQVLTWTVNDVEAMRRLVQCGVDGIISDFPERFAELAG
jgi:glycerophosphoryl diester phosphodiesterase